MQPIRILLADDHTTTRAGLRRVLDEEAGLEVVGEAGDGVDAVRLVGELRPDILLLDISMPGLNGVQVAQALQAARAETRIVVLTGYGDSEEYAHALLRLGVKGYLAKTASLVELAGAIRSAHAGQVYVQPEVSALVYDQAREEPEERPTARELDVLRLLAEGQKNAAIAKTLFVTERTVQFHLHNLFGKLHAFSRTEAVHLARKKKWLS